MHGHLKVKLRKQVNSVNSPQTVSYVCVRPHVSNTGSLKNISVNPNENQRAIWCFENGFRQCFNE